MKGSDDSKKEEDVFKINLLRPDLNAKSNYPDNSIRTRKYTFLNALPMSIINQFNKVSNMYFLLIMIIQLLPNASPVTPLSMLIPFCFVLTVGIVRDLWEDFKRSRADARANKMEVHVLRNDVFIPIPSYKVVPGDVMFLKLGEEVKADCMVLNTSMPEGLVYIETGNLDGEVNTKMRRAQIQTVEKLGTVEDILEAALGSSTDHVRFASYHQGDRNSKKKRLSGCFTSRKVNDTVQNLPSCDIADPQSGSGPPVIGIAEVEIREKAGAKEREKQQEEGLGGGRGRLTSRSTFSLYTLPSPFVEESKKPSYGVVLLCSLPCPDFHSWIGQVQLPSNEVVAVSNAQFLPRGCIIRSTDWVLAAVVYTGKNTKIMQNMRSKPNKTTVMDRSVNKLNICLFLFGQLCNIIICLISVKFNEELLKVKPGVKSGYSTWYLQESIKDMRGMKLFWWRYLTNNVLLSYLIPMSLYVTLEFNKIIQTWMISADKRMAVYDEFTGQLKLARPKTSVLNTQLSQVRYIFTDKTGTLTENLMTYVGGYVAGIVHDERESPGGLGELLLKYLRHRRRRGGEPAQKLFEELSTGAHPPGGVVVPLTSLTRGPPAVDEAAAYDFPVLDEADLETNELFCYLRALALCHCVLCFDVEEEEEKDGKEEQDGRSAPKTSFPDNTSSASFDPATVSAAGPQTPSAAQAPSVFPDLVSVGGLSERRHSPTLEDAEETPAKSPHRVLNQLQVQHLRMLSSGSIQLPRTSSAGWYYQKYNRRSPSADRPPRRFDLSEHIDRSKLYEGPSLDEIALVSAARENGFCLCERTAKEMFVRVMGRVLCYEIVAELDFTPVRKRMSVLLRRNPARDAAAAARGGGHHYYRDRPNAHDGGEGEGPLASSRALKRAENGEKAETADPGRGYPFDRGGRRSREPARVGPPITGRHPAPEGDAETPYLLLVKGADGAMFEIANAANPRNAAMLGPLTRELDEMARRGLRTLVLGQRRLSRQEVAAWMPVFNAAQCSLGMRCALLHEAYALLERDIDLLGASAVEDHLQDGVPETLRFFAQASIVVWMLTGDKRETAVTIAETSGLIDPVNAGWVFHLDVGAGREEGEGEGRGVSAAPSECSPLAHDGSGPSTMAYVSTRASSAASSACGDGGAEQGRSRGGSNTDRGRRSALVDAQLTDAERFYALAKETNGERRVLTLVVDGRTLDVIFSDDKRIERFFALSCNCYSAVCCRMTPLQKAQIVRLFQEKTGLVALAVGDGANDVSMILESQIGISIMGLEGSQAELASDYAIPKFRFLKRLLMVHGRFSMYREAHCILYSIYKNIILVFGLYTYTFYSAFSGVSFIDSWLLSLYGIFFVLLQPVAIGTLDKDVPDELAESLPQLYAPLSREKMYFSPGYIAKWFFDGIVEGAGYFFLVIYGTARKDAMYPANTGGIEDYGQVFFTMLVLAANLKMIITFRYRMIIFTLLCVVVLVSLPTFEIIYAHFHNLPGTNLSVYIAIELYNSYNIYNYMAFVVGVAIVYTISSNVYIQMARPWTNASFAVSAAHASPYRNPSKEKLKRLKEEYASRCKLAEEGGGEGMDAKRRLAALYEISKHKGRKMQ